MVGLTDSQRAEYFHRSYKAVDGLWFVKAEERYGFEGALELDEAVWRVLPKIQARMIRSMLELDGSLEGLLAALEARLEMEGFEFEAEDLGRSLQVEVRRCPWHEIMVRSGREKLSGSVSDVICQVENSVWASEFSDGGQIEFSRDERICRGAPRCLLHFRIKG
ncbi:MAG: DUF6125 family protein [Methanothrix sp.]|nr:DUF6125 family protein [Methanothrix sp.]